MRKRSYLLIFLIPIQYIQIHWLNKTRCRMSRNHIFSSPKCRKWTLWYTQDTRTKIKLSSLDMLIQDYKCGVRVLLLYQSEFTMSKLWYLLIFLTQYKHIQNQWQNMTCCEWTEIAFSALQNAENEHCETLKELVHKSNFHRYIWLYKTLNVVFVYFYSSNLSLQWERVGICR